MSENKIPKTQVQPIQAKPESIFVPVTLKTVTESDHSKDNAQTRINESKGKR